MKKALLFGLIFIQGLMAIAQPKLVVGIVVDQMRYDYIQKYWAKFSEDGFKRLVNEGFSCNNTNYNYVPTFTGPGHASIFTGVTPSLNGIVSNAWVDKATGKNVYCVADKSVATLGSTTSAGKMSPLNLFGSTVGEELLKFSKNKSKVIGIALKDRGAILSAGHHATAAYWYDGSNGNWISSTYYFNALPLWVQAYNSKETAKQYLTQSWETSIPINMYSESDEDDSFCEEPFKGKDKPTFPYNLPSLMKGNGGLGLIRSTPFGNSFTKDFAIQTIKNESLGKGSYSDFLSVSFSSTDYIGHQFGPQSVEVEDCYIKLDKDIADLLKFLDKWVGKKNVLLFLTADHGVSEVVPCLQKKNIPSGLIEDGAIEDSLKKFLFHAYGDSLVLTISDFNIYLNRIKIVALKLNLEEVEKSCVQRLIRFEGVAYAVSAKNILVGTDQKSEEGINQMVAEGFNATRCGDVIFVLKPNWLEGYKKGTTHGSPYPYDIHVPLVWWGYSVTKGSSDEAFTITQIAPTVSEMLKISVPKGCTAKPIRLFR